RAVPTVVQPAQAVAISQDAAVAGGRIELLGLLEVPLDAVGLLVDDAELAAAMDVAEAAAFLEERDHPLVVPRDAAAPGIESPERHASPAFLVGARVPVARRGLGQVLRHAPRRIVGQAQLVT